MKIREPWHPFNLSQHTLLRTYSEETNETDPYSSVSSASGAGTFCRSLLLLDDMDTVLPKANANGSNNDGNPAIREADSLSGSRLRDLIRLSRACKRMKEGYSENFSANERKHRNLSDHVGNCDNVNNIAAIIGVCRDINDTHPDAVDAFEYRVSVTMPGIERRGVLSMA